MWKILKRKTQKGDKTMENYEIKGVSQATEIRKAYEEAVKANAPKYRAVSKTNLIYGWDEKTNKFIKAEIGQEWFDNPHYVAPVEETIEETEDVLDEVVEVAEEMVEEVKAEETVEKIDYKALYEQAQGAIKELLDENGKLKEEIDGLEKDLDRCEEVINNYKEAHKAIMEF